MSIRTVWQFRLQCHLALSSALTLPSHLWFTTAHSQADISSHCCWCLASLLFGNPKRHYDWDMLVWLTGLYTQQAGASKKHWWQLTDMWRQESKWIWQPEEQVNRCWLQPMSSGEPMGPLQRLTLVREVMEMHEEEMQRRMNSYGKRRTLDKGNDRREEEKDKKPRKQKEENYISFIKDICHEPLLFPPTPPQERNYICFSSSYH